MVPLTALWLPILLSAIIVFVASSIMHILLPYHRSDYQRLPDEDKLLVALRSAGLKRGLYIFPFCTHKEMKSPVVIEKYKQGPVGMMTVLPTGPPVMPKFLGMWFVYLPHYRILRRLSHRTHGCARRSLSGRLSRRWHCGVPRLRSRTPEQWHLEGSAVERDLQGSYRWTRLRLTDRRHLWLAVAPLTPLGGEAAAEGVRSTRLREQEAKLTSRLMLQLCGF